MSPAKCPDNQLEEGKAEGRGSEEGLTGSHWILGFVWVLPGVVVGKGCVRVLWMLAKGGGSCWGPPRD